MIQQQTQLIQVDLQNYNFNKHINSSICHNISITSPITPIGNGTTIADINLNKQQ